MRNCRRFIFLLAILIPAFLQAGSFKILTGGVSDGIQYGATLRLFGGIGIESEIFSKGRLKYKLQFETDFIFTVESALESNKYFLNVPVLLKYKFQDINSPYLIFGGYTKYIYSAKKASINSSKNLEMEYGPLLGLGLEWDFNGISLGIEARYQIGIGNIELKKLDKTNRALMVLFSLKFW